MGPFSKLCDIAFLHTGGICRRDATCLPLLPMGYAVTVSGPHLVDPRGGAVCPACDCREVVVPEGKAGKPRETRSVDGSGLNAITGGPPAPAQRNSVRIFESATTLQGVPGALSARCYVRRRNNTIRRHRIGRRGYRTIAGGVIWRISSSDLGV